MEKRIKYSLYKSSYAAFPAHDYRPADKTIAVDLPDYTRPRWPSGWRRVGNMLLTPCGARVLFWGAGLSENFLIEHGSGYARQTKTIPAGLDSRERVIEYVNSISG